MPYNPGLRASVCASGSNTTQNAFMQNKDSIMMRKKREDWCTAIMQIRFVTSLVRLSSDLFIRQKSVTHHLKGLKPREQLLTGRPGLHTRMN